MVYVQKRTTEPGTRKYYHKDRRRRRIKNSPCVLLLRKKRKGKYVYDRISMCIKINASYYDKLRIVFLFLIVRFNGKYPK